MGDLTCRLLYCNVLEALNCALQFNAPATNCGLWTDNIPSSNGLFTLRRSKVQHRKSSLKESKIKLITDKIIYQNLLLLHDQILLYYYLNLLCLRCSTTVFIRLVCLCFMMVHSTVKIGILASHMVEKCEKQVYM